MENKKVWVEGHRGWCAKYPENTMISFIEAMKLGVDAIEFDIRLTKDKVPIVVHDDNALRTCGVGKYFADMTFAEVRELNACYEQKFGDKYKAMAPKIPAFEELLQCCKENFPNIRLGVEIKSFTEETVDKTVELLKKYGYFDTCWFYAFSGKIIRYLKEKYNGRTMGYPDFLMKEFTPECYDYYCELGVSMRVAKSEIGDRFNNSPLPKHFYCADTKEDVEFFLSLGADLITANNPVPLMKILGKLPEDFEE